MDSSASPLPRHSTSSSSESSATDGGDSPSSSSSSSTSLSSSSSSSFPSSPGAHQTPDISSSHVVLPPPVSPLSLPPSSSLPDEGAVPVSPGLSPPLLPVPAHVVCDIAGSNARDDDDSSQTVCVTHENSSSLEGSHLSCLGCAETGSKDSRAFRASVAGQVPISMQEDVDEGGCGVGESAGQGGDVPPGADDSGVVQSCISWEGEGVGRLEQCLEQNCQGAHCDDDLAGGKISQVCAAPSEQDETSSVVSPPRRSRKRNSPGGLTEDLDEVELRSSSPGFRLEEQAYHDRLLEAVSSGALWKASSGQGGGVKYALQDGLPDSPMASPRSATQASPHPERVMMRTQSMPSSSTPGYQGNVDRYRSKTGREGQERLPGPGRKSYEKGDMRKKVAEKLNEKLSERKKRKLLKHLATVKVDGTVDVDVFSSTRYANELFGSGYDREEISLNGYPVPCDKVLRRLQIAMLIVGTRGDVQPFVAIGKRLQEYGHRVRLASHANYRDFVTSAGLEYYPLGGDPKVLAGYMVKNKGFLPSSTSEIRIQRRQMKQICYSLLPACTEADGPGGRPFRAEAIIANPPAYGHVHVAEALKIPIHIFFTMPWTATSQFPHPLARLSVKSPAAYKVSLGIINNFRKKKLKLKPITYLSGTQGSITNLPTGYIWSPHLVPKPKDWGSRIDVVGFCFLNQAQGYKPPEDLLRWLQSGEPPVYIGFGSLPVQDPDGMTRIIVQALEKTKQRGLIDRGWGGIGSKLDKNLPEFVFLTENIPHDWLFPHCAAVVHHGGAGTTAAGLRAACPTTIVPFFGDQPFWGERVHEKGVGPAPIAVGHFSLDRLVKAIEFMLQPQVKQRAVELAKGMENEQGVLEAVEAFHRHLPDMNEPCSPVPLPRSFSQKISDAFSHVFVWCASARNKW